MNIEELFQIRDIRIYVSKHSYEDDNWRDLFRKKNRYQYMEKEYKEDARVCERIDDFHTRYTDAMPVLFFWMIKVIDLETF